MVWLIIGLNLTVLTFVFLVPRAKIISENWGKEQEAIMETSGAMDTPNQFSNTYKVVNQVRKITQGDSMIFIPRNKWGFESNRSVWIQRLYPRELRFYEEKDSFPAFSTVLNKEIYVVSDRSFENSNCEEIVGSNLSFPELGLCRIRKGSPGKK